MAPNNSGLGRILLLAVCVALVIFINRRVHGPGRKNVRRVCAVGEVRLCNCSRSCLPVASWSSRIVLRPCRDYRPIFAVCSPCGFSLEIWKLAVRARAK